MSSHPRRKSTTVRKSLAEDSDQDDSIDEITDKSSKDEQRNKQMNAEGEENFIRKFSKRTQENGKV